MPLFQAPEHQHHHGPLAGVGTGAMAVLVLGVGFLWMVWHRIAEAAGTDAKLMLLGLVILWFGCVAYAVWWLLLRARMHLRQPETLMTRVTVRRGGANQVPAATLRSALSSQPVAELPAPHPLDTEIDRDVLRALYALRETSDPPRLNGANPPLIPPAGGAARPYAGPPMRWSPDQVKPAVWPPGRGRGAGSRSSTGFCWGGLVCFGVELVEVCGD